MFFEIEAGLAVFAVVPAIAAPKMGLRRFIALERSFGRLAQRRRLSVLVLRLTTLATRPGRHVHGADHHCWPVNGQPCYNLQNGRDNSHHPEAFRMRLLPA